MLVAAEEVPQKKEPAGVAEVQPSEVGEKTGLNARTSENDGGGVGYSPSRPEDQAPFFGVPLEGKYNGVVDVADVSPSGGSGSIEKVSGEVKLCLGDDPEAACARSSKEQSEERRGQSEIRIVHGLHQTRWATTAESAPKVQEREEASNKSERKRMTAERLSKESKGPLTEGGGGDTAAHVDVNKVKEVGRELVQALWGSNIGKVEVNSKFSQTEREKKGKKMQRTQFFRHLSVWNI